MKLELKCEAYVLNCYARHNMGFIRWHENLEEREHNSLLSGKEMGQKRKDSGRLLK